MAPPTETLKAPEQAVPGDDATFKREAKEAVGNYMACMNEMSEFATGEGPLQNRLNSFRQQLEAGKDIYANKDFWKDPNVQKLLHQQLGPDYASQIKKLVNNPKELTKMMNTILANFDAIKNDPNKFAEFVTTNVQSMCASDRISNAELEKRRNGIAQKADVDLTLPSE
jgi:hypothetical protein